MLRKKSRITAYSLFIALLACTGYAVYDYIAYQQDRTRKSIALGQQVKTDIANQIDSLLQQISSKGRKIADSLENHDFEANELLYFIRSESFSMEQILGVTVAFEPYKYNDSTRLYAPYYDKSHSDFVFIEEIYDYTDSTLSTSQWYTNVRDFGQGWIEPYFAEGAQAMVSDFGVPLHLWCILLYTAAPRKNLCSGRALVHWELSKVQQLFSLY